jgi:Flp pilus assembly protein TadB
VDWLLLGGLCIMWAAFLIPTGRRRHTGKASVDEFEHRMELLAQAEVHGTNGRWIVTPRKGVRFLGPQERQRSRARERRRKVFVVLIDAILLSFLIGLVPPLRVVWYVSAGLAGLLLLYVWLLVSIKARQTRPHERVRAAAVPERPKPGHAPRFVAEGRSATARPTFNGLGAIGQHDPVHVVVRPASAVVNASA